MAQRTPGEIDAEIRTRSLVDPAFRTRLLQNPRSVLASEFGLELPENVTVQILEDTPDTAFIVLPYSGVLSRATEGATAADIVDSQCLMRVYSPLGTCTNTGTFWDPPDL